MDLIRITYHDRKAGPINKVHRFAVLIPLIERERKTADGSVEKAVEILFETRAAELDAQDVLLPFVLDGHGGAFSRVS